MKQIEEILFSHSARFLLLELCEKRTWTIVDVAQSWIPGEWEKSRFTIRRRVVFCAEKEKMNFLRFFHYSLFSCSSSLPHENFNRAFFRLPLKIAHSAPWLCWECSALISSKTIVQWPVITRWFAAKLTIWKFDAVRWLVWENFPVLLRCCCCLSKDFLTCMLFLCKNTTFLLHYLFSARRDILSLLLRLHEGRAHGSLVWKLGLTLGVGGSTNGKKKSLLESLKKNTQKISHFKLVGSFWRWVRTSCELTSCNTDEFED